MAADILTSLQIDKQLPGRVIVVKEINNCDSSFLISSVLNHSIKNKHGIFVISTHNSLSHYQNVGIKMNYNLLKHIDSGLVKFYNLGEECVNDILNNEQKLLQTLTVKLKETIQQMQTEHAVVNIILDGITHLLDLQFSLRDINYFCKEVVNIARANNSFVLCHCHVASEDDVSNVIPNLLSHKSDILLEIENLSSGWSADVSGHLTIKHTGRKFEQEHIYTIDIKPSKYLFKLFDRGVKLFAPGTV